jgi:hypothetical protein
MNIECVRVIFAGDIFDAKMTIDDEMIKSSR